MPAPSADSKRIKLLLVPILGLVLAGLLLWPSKEETLEQGGVELSQQAAATLVAEVSSQNVELWKAVDLSATGQTNPFANLQWGSAPAHGGGNSDGSSVTSTTVDTDPPGGKQITRRLDAIVTRSGKSYACIDNQVATVGDTLRDGARILSIDGETVVLIEAAK